MSSPVVYIDRQSDFDLQMEAIKGHSWVGFDTEFIGEKYYIPQLCLMQIVSKDAILLVDTLRVTNLSSFLSILSDPEVEIITHAGDNDYRLLNTLFGVVPKNIFDIQIAAGFAGYNYPAGLSKIVEGELRVSLSKSHTIADWSARPIDKKALMYAIEDVKYLSDIHQKLSARLQKKQRISWAKEEFEKWENPAFYVNDPYKDALNSDMIYQLDRKEKLFLLRIRAWRRQKAAEQNIPREHVLPAKHVSSIMRATKDGGHHARANRTLPEHLMKRHQQEWIALWRQPESEEERRVLATLPPPPMDNPDMEWHFELLYHLIKKRCADCEISPALVFPRSDFNKLKNGHPEFDQAMLEGWRAEILGADIIRWFRADRPMQVEWLPDGGCRIFN